MPSPQSKRERLLVLYASQTGNAMDAAERIGRETERRGCASVMVLSMDEYGTTSLRSEDAVVFVVSTTGQGDIPDSMKGFWRWLLQRNLGSRWLEGVNYAVFGLGDSGYQKYNFAAKKLDKRLSDLGGKPIIERGLGDDQHPSGYEGTFDPWLQSLYACLNELKPSLLPSASEMESPNIRTPGQPKFCVEYHPSGELLKKSSSAEMKEMLMEIERARSMSDATLRSTDIRPHYFLKMVKNEQLTIDTTDRDVRHFEFESLTSKLEYQVGDVLEILPSQDPSMVDAFIQRCGLNPDSYISVRRVDAGGDSTKLAKRSNFDPIRLRTFVELNMDVASASPRRYFFEVMSFFATAEHEKDRLQYFASSEGRDDLYSYNQKERRTVLEVLEDFPSVQMPFEWLVQLVPPLKPRAFSISSSPLVHPERIHLTVSIVSWTTPFKRKRRGLCSSWLVGIDPVESEVVYLPAWIKRSSIPPPQPLTPLILIGPGTGCAPFRAFVQERAVQSLSVPTGPILFFFGCRNEKGDFLYQDFWLTHSQGSGVISAENGGGFFVAFSRDQPQKVYVQHKMKEQSLKVWSLLRDGAVVYIAGSSNKMPGDVTSALEEIISQEADVPHDSAARWLKQQERAGKFFIESWS